MSKILFIGDPHLKITKFTLAKSFLEWLNEYIEEHKDEIDFVVNLGDTFDSHSVVRSEVMGEFRAHLEHVLQFCPYIYVLGNHDMYKPDDSRYHALGAYKGIHPNLTVVDEIRDIGGITYVPYQPTINSFPKQTNSICVAHQQFIGCDYGYHRPEIGVDADRIKCDMIISGHIHKRQMFGKVIYPGTPFAQDIRDVDQDKGIMLFDTDTLKYNFVTTPLPQWKSIQVDMLDNDIDMEHDILAKTMNDTHHWLIDIKGPKSELVAYLNSDMFLKLKEGKRVRVRPTYVEKIKKKIAIKSITVGGIVNEYVDKVYDGSLDRDMLKSRIVGIIGK